MPVSNPVWQPGTQTSLSDVPGLLLVVTMQLMVHPACCITVSIVRVCVRLSLLVRRSAPGPDQASVCTCGGVKGRHTH